MATKKSKKNQKNFIQRSKLLFEKIYCFFVQDDTKLKIECKTEVLFDQINNKIKIRRSFYTFRSLRSFVWWYVTQNQYEKAKKLLGQFEQNPAYALRLAGAFSVFLLISIFDFKSISNVTLVAGAIAFDSTSSVNATDSTDPKTFSHTTSGSNRTLTLSIGAVRDDTGVTYNSVSLTRAVYNYYASSANATIYYLGDPASGTNTVSVDMSALANGYATFCAVSFSGSNSSSPLGATNTVGHNSSLTSESLSITTSYDNSILVDSFYIQPCYTGSTWTPYTGQTQRNWQSFINDNGQGGTSTKPTTTAGSYTMRWDKSSGATPFRTVLSIIEIRELGAVNVSVDATVVTATFSIPAYTVTGQAIVSPSAQVVTASIPSYNVSVVANTSSSPSAQVCTFSIPTYSISGDSNIAVNTQIATFSIPAYFVEAGNVQVSPDAQVCTFSIPAYSVDVVANISVSPSAQVCTFSIPTYTASGEASVSTSVSTQIATFSIPTYTVAVESNITVSPSAQVLTFSIPSYTSTGSAIASPSVQTLTFSIPTFTITTVAHITISPEAILLAISIPTFVIVADYWQDKYANITSNWSDKYANITSNWSDKYANITSNWSDKY